MTVADTVTLNVAVVVTVAVAPRMSNDLNSSNSTNPSTDDVL